MSVSEKLQNLSITEELYKIAHVISLLEELKDFGLLTGGYDIDREALNYILKEGQRLNYKRPNLHEAMLIFRIIESDSRKRRINL